LKLVQFKVKGNMLAVSFSVARLVFLLYFQFCGMYSCSEGLG